jgi:hypothetical protein
MAGFAMRRSVFSLARRSTFGFLRTEICSLIAWNTLTFKVSDLTYLVGHVDGVQFFLLVPIHVAHHENNEVADDEPFGK